MKILISPSKTMAKSKVEPMTRALIFENEKVYLKDTIKKLSLSKLKTLLDVNEKLANQNYERYQNFHENHAALFTYTGAQFKALNALNLNQNALHYLDENLMILSGLYGLLKPYDCIALYRLPMALKINKNRLSDFWKEKISNHLNDELIINLASKEYSSVLEDHLNTIDIEFYVLKGGKYITRSMEVKRIRGLFVRFLAVNQIKNLEHIKLFNEDNYSFQVNCSTTTKFVFVKNED